LRWWVALFVAGTIAHFALALIHNDAAWIERGGGFTAVVGALGAAAALIAAQRFDKASSQLNEMGDVLDDEQRKQLTSRMSAATVRHQTVLILIAALGSAQQAYADTLFVALQWAFSPYG
jgi:hypothetical protein